MPSDRQVPAIRKAIYAFCHQLARRTAAAKEFRLSLKMLLEPLNYWRNIEVPAVIDQLEVRPSDIVLDIGSPKIASLFLSSRHKCVIYSTDLFDYFWEEYRGYLKHLRDAALLRTFIMERQDARRLSYADAYFDKIYSISVLEHIAADGDTLAMCEISRVLKKGGICCITVPCSSRYRETYTTTPSYYITVNGERPTFYERHYDESALWGRLIAPSGLQLVRLQYFSERFVPYEKLYGKLPFPIKVALAPWSRVATRLFIAPTDRAVSQHATTAILTLRK
jgi:SAM-dependent methyltransferase